MQQHKFKVGQMVSYFGQGTLKAARGEYTVIARLPADSRGPQYRIKSKQEPHERLVSEPDLSSA
jgi:hypothetical protein